MNGTALLDLTAMPGCTGSSAENPACIELFGLRSSAAASIVYNINVIATTVLLFFEVCPENSDGLNPVT